MSRSVDEWAPITDADLLEEEEVAPQVSLPVSPPPLPLLPPAPPSKRQPVYSTEDWKIFDYWVRQKDFSIDQAAACAGIAVYDALVALQKRNPWFYEFKVMVGPQGNKTASTRRRRGALMNVGGQGKNYERVTYGRKSDGEQQNNRLTEEEARERFLALLGDAHPEDRVDGVRDNNRRVKAVHPATGRERLQAPVKKKRQVRFTSGRKCRHCGGSDHDRRNCKDLHETPSVPAGLESPTTEPPEGV